MHLAWTFPIFNFKRGPLEQFRNGEEWLSSTIIEMQLLKNIHCHYFVVCSHLEGSPERRFHLGFYTGINYCHLEIQGFSSRE